MEQKSFFSGIKAQSPSEAMTAITDIPTLPAVALTEVEYTEWMESSSSSANFEKKHCLSFTIPPFQFFLFPKII